MMYGYPMVQFTCTGDGSEYSQLSWTGGSGMPSQAALDQWKLEHGGGPSLARLVTDHEYRTLFTYAECLVIDSLIKDTTLLADQKMALTTYCADTSASVVSLDYPGVAAGLAVLVTLGAITDTRRSTILAGIPQW